MNDQNKSTTNVTVSAKDTNKPGAPAYVIVRRKNGVDEKDLVYVSMNKAIRALSDMLYYSQHDQVELIAEIREFETDVTVVHVEEAVGQYKNATAANKTNRRPL